MSMNNEYIAVLDSGIGGLNVLKKLYLEFPNENFIYFGDNLNAPYGNRTDRDLLSLSVDNVNALLRFNIKLIVIACNTLSVNVLSILKEIFPNIPFVGIFPPVETEEIAGRKTLILATDRTAQKFLGRKNIDSIGLSWLVKKIEDNPFFDFNLRSLFYKKENYDTVILGCTHFIYLKNQIFKILTTKKIADGTQNTILQVKKVLANQKSSVNYYRNEVLFFGENWENNKKIWEIILFKEKIFQKKWSKWSKIMQKRVDGGQKW